MSFPRYPKYEASGVEWMGDVPEHWAVAALAYRYRVELGKMLDAKQISGEHLLPYVRNADVQWGRINTDDLNCMDFAPDERERFRLRAGDLLVCEGGEVGRCAVWDSPLTECYYQKAIHRLRAFDAATDDATFLRWVLEAAVRRGCFESSESKATIAHLPAETFRRHRFPFPPLPEQRAIAAFLDRETAKIDGLVAEQQRLIELLKEKRQAVISHAVTKGLDPKAPMKPSGVEWLGDVPANWGICTLRRVTSACCDGPFGSGLKSEHYRDHGVRVIRLQNIKARQFDDRDSAFIDATYCAETLGDHYVEGGDLLIAGLGDENNTVGRACVAPQDLGRAMVKADCFRFRLDRGSAEPAFVAAALCSGAKHAAGTLATGSTRSRISLTEMASRRLPLPPLPEQRAIAAFLDRETAKIDGLVAEAESAIALLQERRSALISAAVTGQIDVRNVVATEAA